MTRPTDAELGWLAGLIDGEGTISITRLKENKYHYTQLRPLLHIVNCDRRLLDRAADIIERITHKRPSFVVTPRGEMRPAYRLPVKTAWELSILLPTLRPFLVGKQEQADIVLEFCSLCRIPGMKGYPAEIVRQRALLCLQSLRLNRRGPRGDESIAELERMLAQAPVEEDK